MGHGYLIMDYIEKTEAEMLSEFKDELHHDRKPRINFIKDLSHIILALNQSPLHRIGSRTIDERGVLMLTNRPLAHHFHSLENEGIPTNIPRDLPYMTTNTYYTDLLGFHDSYIRNQPNLWPTRKTTFHRWQICLQCEHFFPVSQPTTFDMDHLFSISPTYIEATSL